VLWGEDVFDFVLDVLGQGFDAAVDVGGRDRGGVGFQVGADLGA
jgi:hypothetical protein